MSYINIKSYIVLYRIFVLAKAVSNTYYLYCKYYFIIYKVLNIIKYYKILKDY